MKTSQGSLHTHSSKIYNFKSFKVIEPLSESADPVYKVLSTENGQIYALKIFQYEKDSISRFFANESRFTTIRHPNIIKYLHWVANEMGGSDSNPRKFSYILMEYAPYGDFTSLIMNYPFYADEKLVRTYFHQLIEGVHYLHSNKVYHLDLKLDNMLLGENYVLKIADFDISCRKGDQIIVGNGTANYRAPEVRDRGVVDPAASDIYSLGIILFIMMMGHYPYSEKSSHVLFDGLWDLMLAGDEKFWNVHAKIRSLANIPESFKSLFQAMTKANPSERATIRQVKRSQWYLGPTYTQKELESVMKELLSQGKVT